MLWCSGAVKAYNTGLLFPGLSLVRLLFDGAPLFAAIVALRSRATTALRPPIRESSNRGQEGGGEEPCYGPCYVGFVIGGFVIRDLARGGVVMGLSRGALLKTSSYIGELLRVVYLGIGFVMRFRCIGGLFWVNSIRIFLTEFSYRLL